MGSVLWMDEVGWGWPATTLRARGGQRGRPALRQDEDVMVDW